MGNLEDRQNEIKAFVQEIGAEIAVDEYFELGDAPRPLTNIDARLRKMSELLNQCSDFYYSKSMLEINSYDDVVQKLREAQSFLAAVRVKGGGSKENTLQFQALIDELGLSIVNLLRQNACDVSVMNSDLGSEEIEAVAQTPSNVSVDGECRLREVKPLAAYRQSVFISYAWGGKSEEVTNQIDDALQKRGLKIVRDKRNLHYKGSIKEFMERIGQGDCVIVVVSDKYLKSPNCMFELVEISDNKQFYDRVFPVVLSDADIYDPMKKLDYVQYWRNKKLELNKKMKKMDQEHLDGVRDDIDRYARIGENIARLTDILSDMNTLTPERHQNTNFDSLYNAIEKRRSRIS